MREGHCLHESGSAGKKIQREVMLKEKKKDEV